MLIFLLMTAIAIPVVPVAAISDPTPGKDATGAKIIITVYLGRKKKDCTGFGICDATIGWEKPTGSNNGPRVATGDAWIENGKLNIAFNRSSLEPGTFQAYFSDNLFKVEEDFVLSPEVATSLGINAYTVRAGTYPVGQSSDGNILPVSF